MKLLKITSLFLLLGLLQKEVVGQHQEHFEFEKKAAINVSDLDPSWHAELFSLEAPYPGSDTYRNYIHQLKALRYTNYVSSDAPLKSIATINSDAPRYDIGFEGNKFGGIPNDNDIAISNDGKIVSVSNSDMYVYNESGAELFTMTLEDFADSLGLVTNSYDPKVIYDPLEDKFILVFLNGNDQASSDIVICFSQTNDPTQSWNVYSVPGNPFNDGAWSDFPMIAMTTQDLFVTVNHIHSDSASWQTGFMQSVIWQVQKNEGYQGGTLTSVIHSNIKFQNRSIRNLMPVEGGYTLHPNEMYFMSNRNFDFQNDTFFMVKIAEPLSQNLNSPTSVQYVIADEDYGLPPDAKQSATAFLQTNDARPLGGFIESNIIQFVGNTVNLSSGLASIYHGRINLNLSSLSVDLSVLSDTVLEYGYPNISFSGQTVYDDQAIISFNHTSIDSFPGMSAIFYSLDDGYSNRLHLKSGNSVVNLLSGNFERWGDYSGSQRKYNQSGEVWVSGFIGSKNVLLSSDRHKTYIAKLTSLDSLNVSIRNENLQATQALVYPNPVQQLLNVQFEIDTKMNLSFVMFDALGRQVAVLMQRTSNAGKHEFIFSTEPLKTGSYFLKAYNEFNEVLFIKQILKD